MGSRTPYGNAFSENGWPMVNEGSCSWVTVPGTGVSLEIQQGQPLAILRAFAADFSAYVEPLRDQDSACWTATNSVATSNHLSGTACDFNWNTHPMGNQDAGYPQSEINTIRELLGFYEATVFWGNDWDSPKDSMHFQIGYDTYNNPHTADFVARKIRADGFSTFRRSGTVPLSRADRYASAIIAEGRRLGITPRGIKIALSVGLVESNLTMYANSNDPASLNFPHDAVGSDHMSSGIFQQQPPWGPLADRMDVTRSATIFFTVDNGGGVRGLTKIRDANGYVYDYNNTGRTPGFYAQKVQGSAFPDRYDQRFADAEAIYNRLATTTGEGELSAQAETMIEEIHGALFNQVPSQSIYATPGEGARWKLHELIKNDDGMLHELHVEDAALRGDLNELARVARVAAGQGVVTDLGAINRARNVLAEIETNNPDALKAFIAAQNGATK